MSYKSRQEEWIKKHEPKVEDKLIWIGRYGGMVDDKGAFRIFSTRPPTEEEELKEIPGFYTDLTPGLLEMLEVDTDITWYRNKRPTEFKSFNRPQYIGASNKLSNDWHLYLTETIDKWFENHKYKQVLGHEFLAKCKKIAPKARETIKPPSEAEKPLFVASPEPCIRPEWLGKWLINHKIKSIRWDGYGWLFGEDKKYLTTMTIETIVSKSTTKVEPGIDEYKPQPVKEKYHIKYPLLAGIIE